jgi:pimeloyl-ACP methyl ester carboxylesterase
MSAARFDSRKIDTMRDVTTPDGRTLRVHEGWATDGAPIVVLNGTPMSGRLYGPHVEDAAARGARLFGYDRPGYAASSSHEGRSVADAAEDVRTIADALGLDRFAVWGISGGGPHALACAALLPDRVVAAASLASVAPRDAEGLDWTAGMGEMNLEEFAVVREGRDALEEYLEREAEGLASATAEGLIEALTSLLTPVDAAALSGELGGFLAKCTRESVAAGVAGWRDDDLAFEKSWGFSLEDIRVPVQLWQGKQDRFVPFAHGEWLAARIPGVEAHLSPDDGHITLLARRVPEVHEWLLERF